VTELGYRLFDEQLEALSTTPRRRRTSKEVDNEDLAFLIEKSILDVTLYRKPESLHTATGTVVIPTATVSIRRPDGVLMRDAAIGDGLVDAIFEAVERVTGIAANLRKFAVRGVTAGEVEQGEVSLELEVAGDDRTSRGRAASTDIIEASAKVYINAVSAIVTRGERDQPREVIGRTVAGA
jgi:2-isopropylmalate synthase